MKSEITYNLKAKISLFPTNNGGRKNPVVSGYRPSLAFNTAKNYCSELELTDIKELSPGETADVTIKLLSARTIRKNLSANDTFSLLEGVKIVGTGIIKEVQKIVN